jgi:hypothetical protein
LDFDSDHDFDGAHWCAEAPPDATLHGQAHPGEGGHCKDVNKIPSNSSNSVTQKQCQRQALARSTMLRANANLLIQSHFKERYNAQIEHFTPLSKQSQQQPNPLTDPKGMEVMMEAMKKNMMNVIPQTIIMTAINYFFEGFVVGII